MITIDAKTKQTWNTTEHEPQVFGHFGYNITPGYIRGWCPPNYQVPAIPLVVDWRPESVTHYRTLCFIKRAYTERIHAMAAWWFE